MPYKIYVSTFGQKIKPVWGGVPLEVGAQGRSSFIYELKDNTGDHISNENPYYGELTGLYWVWKMRASRMMILLDFVIIINH